MSEVQVFDKALCCSSGVCGAQVDQELVRFANDLEWLKQQGHQVERYNLAHEPAKFTQNEKVQALLADSGADSLPLVLVDGNVMSRSEYPKRENLAMWTGTKISKPATLPVLGSDCCGGGDCC